MSGEFRGDKHIRSIATVASIGAGLFTLLYWYRRPITAWRESEGETSASSLVRHFLPKAEFAGEVSVNVHAAPEAVYAAIRRVTLDDMPLARFLGQLRYLPAALSNKAAPTTASQARPFLEVLQTDSSNIILAEVPPRELVIGAIGKFHQLFDQQFVKVGSPKGFLAFDQPDYQKLVMSFKITQQVRGSGCRLTLVHGTHALSNAARRYFALYWTGIKPGGNFVSWQLLRAIREIAEKQSQRMESV